MGTDRRGSVPDSFGPVQGMMVSYDAPDVAEARRVFDALSAGGNVTQELMPTFFSEAFGMCTDKFGTPWMIVGPSARRSLKMRAATISAAH